MSIERILSSRNNKRQAKKTPFLDIILPNYLEASMKIFTKDSIFISLD